MTKEKVIEVLAEYRQIFEDMEIPKRKFPHDALAVEHFDCLAHCHSMIDEMEVFIDEGRMEKVARWLGFIQGVLFACGKSTIGESKSRNRPDSEKVV